jgi:UDP-N-acetylglucosamine 2-epimerase (non-hydrolysing)
MSVSVLIVLGTRPEAIKLAPLILLLKARHDCMVHVCVTGQHREMLDQVLQTFSITPDSDLQLMQNRQSLAGLSVRAMMALDQVLERVQPDWMIVQGDTTTAMIGALTAFYRKIKVLHVEAGLRTYNNFHPYPEEVNRRIIDVLADVYATPTEESKHNLLREGIQPERIVVTGNTGIDALLMIAQRDTQPDFLQNDRIHGKQIILVTSHRRENLGEPMQQVFLALRDLAERYSTTHHLVFPVHLNPAVQQLAQDIIGNISGITLCAPLPYQDMVAVMQRSVFVITDSGGIQEEAPSLGKPVIITRETTERPEVVQSGAGFLAGSNRTMIVRIATQLIEDNTFYAQSAQIRHLYGNGMASAMIADLVLS